MVTSTVTALPAVERPQWGSPAVRPDDGIGSGPANQSAELVALNLPVELGCDMADIRLGRVPTRR